MGRVKVRRAGELKGLQGVRVGVYCYETETTWLPESHLREDGFDELIDEYDDLYPRRGCRAVKVQCLKRFATLKRHRSDL